MHLRGTDVPMPEIMGSIGVGLGVVACVAVIIMVTRAVRAIPRVVFQPPSRQSHLGSQVVMLPTARGNRIPAFFFDRKAQHTILVSHGNAEDLSECACEGRLCVTGA